MVEVCWEVQECCDAGLDQEQETEVGAVRLGGIGRWWDGSALLPVSACVHIPRFLCYSANTNDVLPHHLDGLLRLSTLRVARLVSDAFVGTLRRESVPVVTSIEHKAD